ncbi:hypothetical protein EB1_16190 [Empedobacter brevis NBRC 14943 = ATCC 43319]|uniref:Uncharacterized protein n=1 Tax=Empedobacter brevis NBRC 14943 = ATCC 43319 TaxID=1218108 RepID=A0A511NGA7_9FLAO|nr:hypothetical protein EB1_16190 [Empedobacter brevis NBRC 14943 = ATCC 43319]
MFFSLFFPQHLAKKTVKANLSNTSKLFLSTNIVNDGKFSKNISKRKKEEKKKADTWEGQ